MKYKQLTLAKRYHISTLIKQGYKQGEIAKEIGVSPSTISRELKRNSDGKYSPELAQINYHKRVISKNKRSAITPIRKISAIFSKWRI